MGCRLDELRKKCLFWRLKRGLLPLVLVVSAGGVFWYYVGHKDRLELFSKEQKKVVQKTLPQKIEPSKEQRRCLSLQLAYLSINASKFNERLHRFMKRLTKAGFICHTRKEGEKIAILCDTQKSKKDLLPFIHLAKKRGLDYQIRSDECKFLSKNKPLSLASHLSKAKTSMQMFSSKQSTRDLIQSAPFNPQEAKKLFAKRKSYDLAMKLARYYFNRSDFHKALFWAKRANEFNKENEASWILYARSLYHLGKKAKAKRVLRIYLEYKDSANIREILKRWQ